MDLTAVKRVGVNDLVLLNNPNDQNVVQNLRERYMEDIIYTNIGPVLIAVNPFKLIPGIYTDSIIRKYKGRNAFELSPHVYSLADQALRNLTTYRESQCVIITGESGSGKTETSKIVMQYISACSGKSADVVRVKEHMLASNPALEAFGNAKTLRNDNSSRFGKYMRIEFDSRGDPVGGVIQNYLLEKIRVVDPSNGERNFHIFYQVCAGMDPQSKERYQIYGPDQYSYLVNSQCFVIPGVNDAKAFNETMEALNSLGATPGQLDSIFNVISAILWLGNVTFTEDNSERSTCAEMQTIGLVAHLMQVDVNILVAALTTRKIETGVGARVEIFTKPLKAADAYITRDTLAKALYSKMFDYIVKLANESLALGGQKQQEELIHIGLLDIYGFEIFQVNSFEQLCINFVNERLQQVFIEQTLKAEQEEYTTEGIPWTNVDYYNNKPCCELIENKPGILSILDDACNSSKGDAGFLSDVSSFFQGNAFLRNANSHAFSIAHYAGEVSYASQGFTLKNKDTLFDDLVQCIQKSNGSYVIDHGWNEIEILTGQKKKPPTVGMIFKSQVGALMAELGQCTPHYCRCIKPNETKKPRDFDVQYTQNQVQYLGLCENVRVRQAGYAQKLPFDRFVNRYAIICPQIWNNRRQGSMNDPKRATQAIMQHLNWSRDLYAMGQTKVFIRSAESSFMLEASRETMLNRSALIIQRAFKRHSNKRASLEIAYHCYTVLGNRKERRRASIDRLHRCDYINLCLNQDIRDQLNQEAILFADRVVDIKLKGKQTMISKMFGKTKPFAHPKFIALTCSTLCCMIMSQPDPATGIPSRMVIEWRINLASIVAVTLSPYSDNVYIIEAQGVQPVMQSCRRKTELIGLLHREVSRQRPLTLNFTEQLPLNITHKGKIVPIGVRFFLSPQFATEESISVPNGNPEVRVGAGIPGHVFQAPHKPREIDMSMQVRDQVEAIYDYPGNGVDELSVKVGDLLYVISDDGDGWMKAEASNGQKGFVPATYVKLLPKKAKQAPPPRQGPSPPQMGRPPQQAMPQQMGRQGPSEMNRTTRSPILEQAPAPPMGRPETRPMGPSPPQGRAPMGQGPLPQMNRPAISQPQMPMGAAPIGRPAMPQTMPSGAPQMNRPGVAQPQMPIGAAPVGRPAMPQTMPAAAPQMNRPAIAQPQMPMGAAPMGRPAPQMIRPQQQATPAQMNRPTIPQAVPAPQMMGRPMQQAPSPMNRTASGQQIALPSGGAPLQPLGRPSIPAQIVPRQEIPAQRAPAQISRGPMQQPQATGRLQKQQTPPTKQMMGMHGRGSGTEGPQRPAPNGGMVARANLQQIAQMPTGGTQAAMMGNRAVLPPGPSPPAKAKYQGDRYFDDASGTYYWFDTATGVSTWET